MTEYRICSAIGCGKRIPAGQGKCNRHRAVNRKQSDAKRPNSTDRGYGSSTGWPKIRDAYLRRNPVCERAGCNQPATDVHHIDGRGPYGDNTDGNLMALCHADHSYVTQTTVRRVPASRQTIPTTKPAAVTSIDPERGR